MNREILITFAMDVPCYGTVTTALPADVDMKDLPSVKAWVMANADSLSSQCEYDPEWEYSDGLRVIDAQIEEGNCTVELFEDTGYPLGLPKLDVGNLAIEVVTQCEQEIIKSNLSRATVMRLLAIIG